MKVTPPILCVMGATATGKTDLAIALQQQLPVEIVSVDSAMVYRHMDIGTAKPTPDELIKAPHHLINLREPEEHYSAGDFRQDALRLINEIQSRDKIPLFVGGTMLYFHVLQHGVAKLPKADPQIRSYLNDESERIGWPAMHKKLSHIDPKTAAQLHPNDSQRIQRALEVYEITGEPLSTLQEKHHCENPQHSFVSIILEPHERKVLHERIARRFHQMLEQGFLEEMRELMKRPDLNLDAPSMRTVGYRQAWSHLKGEYDKESMIEKAIAATRQLAKRQLTWLRRWHPCSRFDFEDQKLQQRVMEQINKEIACI